MMSQVLTDQLVRDPGVRAFSAVLRAHAAATRELNAQLVTDHGLTLSDFEVLLRLSQAPDRRMRRVDLAEQVLLTASGITRLLDGLESAGYVERGTCATDRRVVYAVLTEAGQAKLHAAASDHFAQVEELFGARFGEDELTTLADLLARLGEEDSLPCEPGP